MRLALPTSIQVHTNDMCCSLQAVCSSGGRAYFVAGDGSLRACVCWRGSVGSPNWVPWLGGAVRIVRGGVA